MSLYSGWKQNIMEMNLDLHKNTPHHSNLLGTVHHTKQVKLVGVSHVERKKKKKTLKHPFQRVFWTWLGEVNIPESCFHGRLKLRPKHLAYLVQSSAF